MSNTKQAGAWPTIKLVAFFASNPDESLGTKDMARKFDMTVENIRPIARRLSRQGWLDVEIRRGQGGDSIWTAGPVLLKTIGAAR